MDQPESLGAEDPRKHHRLALRAKLEELSEIRSELCVLKDPMLQCPKVDRTELRKLLWPREYLWIEPTLYSYSDLVEACYGVTDMNHCESLKPFLIRLIRFCTQHAKTCSEC